MGTQKQREKTQKNLWVGLLSCNCNCPAPPDIKFLLTLLFLLCSFATVAHFLPSNFSLSSSLRLCLSSLPATNATNTTTNAANTTTEQAYPPSPHDVVLPSGTIKRTLTPHGSAAYAFILMSAYRTGLNTFSIIGLSSKPLHLYSTPSYQCQYLPFNTTSAPSTVAADKILPDWGFGRVYTAVVITCTFPSPVVLHPSGGRLLLVASTNGGGDKNLNLTDTIPALTEPPNASINPSYYTNPPKYDYLYCGSPLFGKISPQSIREWLAYHVRLFGTSSHFVMYDAGGVDEAVMEVLRPWMEKGYVSLHDVREQERFDGYYHNQFLIVNDCLHRYRFDAKWMFFFDVDEFIYVVKKKTIRSVTESVSDFTQIFIQQISMASNLCLSEDEGVSYR